MQENARSTARPLRVSWEPTPALQVENYETSGRYPQVSRGGMDLSAVNATLLRAIRADQRRYTPGARRYRDYPRGPGTYATSGGRYTRAKPWLVSASTVVVSALIPLTSLYPGGNDGSVWIAVTAKVPSGTRVRIRDLFANPAEGLEALAASVRYRVLSADAPANRCVRGWVGHEIGAESFLDGSKPVARNYRDYALTPTGLAVGFANSQVASPSCGRIVTIVPYSVVAPFLSNLGERLVSGVRHPRS